MIAIFLNGVNLKNNINIHRRSLPKELTEEKLKYITNGSIKLCSKIDYEDIVKFVI